MQAFQNIVIDSLNLKSERIQLPYVISLKYQVLQEEFRSMIYFPKGYAILIHGDFPLELVTKIAVEAIEDALNKPINPTNHLSFLIRRDFSDLY